MNVILMSVNQMNGILLNVVSKNAVLLNVVVPTSEGLYFKTSFAVVINVTHFSKTNIFVGMGMSREY